MSFRKLLATALVASMVFGLFGTALAQPSASDAFYDQAADILKHFSIIIGDPSGDMRYGDSISRAEMITVLVRSLGKEGDANLLRGAPAFSDTATHWSSGYVALAKNAGLTVGFPDGTFKPDAQMTYAQAITFLVRLVGIEPTSTEWPAGYIQAGIQAGIIPQDAAALRAVDAPAIRGDVFVMLATAVADIKLPSGKTLLQTHFDSTPPTLTIDAVDTVTTRSVATISGTAGDAVGVFVNGMAVALADGSFSADVTLQIGANEIMITAVDLVGNEASKTVAIERQNTAAASIEVDTTLTVEAGGTADLKVVVLDSNGAPIPDALVDVESEVGTWADGVFTASEVAGAGALTLTSGDAVAEVDVTVTAGPLAALIVTPDQEVASTNAVVKFTAVGNDQFGNEVAVSGVQWSTSSGVIDANGNLAATASGEVIVTASLGDITGTGKVTIFGTAVALKLELAGGLTANGRSTTTATATAVDASGNRVQTFNSVINFNTSNTASVVIDTNLAGKSVVATEGRATVSLKSGTAGTTSTAVISVSSTGLSGASASIAPVQQQVAKLMIVADPAAMSATSATNMPIFVKAVDQDGFSIPNTSTALAGMQGRLSSSNTAVATFAGAQQSPALTNTNFTDDDNIRMLAATVFATLTATNTPGSTTITGSFTQNGVALTVPVESLTVNTHIVGAPAKITVDEVGTIQVDDAALTVTERDRSRTHFVAVRLFDLNGNPVSSDASVTVILEAVSSAASASITADGTVPVSGTGIVSASTASLNHRFFRNGQFMFAVRTDKVGTMTYTARGWYAPLGATPTLIGAVTATGEVTGGSVTNVLSLGDTRVNVGGIGNRLYVNADGVSTVTLTGRLRDAGNNRVSEGSYPITFRKLVDNGGTAAFSETTINSVNGEASVTLRSTTTPGIDTYQVSARISANQTVQTTILVASVAMGTPTQVVVYATDSNPDVAGNETTWLAYVADAAGNPVGTDSGRTIEFRVTRTHNAAVLDIDTQTAVNSRGTATFRWTPTTAATYQVTAYSPGLTNAAAVNITIVGGELAKLYMEMDTVAGVAADGVSFAIITVRSRDQYNNNVNVVADTDVRLEVPSTLFGGFGAGRVQNATVRIRAGSSIGTTEANVPAGNPGGLLGVVATDVHFTSATQPGTAVITATATGTSLAPATLEMPVYLAGQSVGLKVVPANTSRATGRQSTVQVALVDANGNPVTNPLVAHNVRLTAIAPDNAASATFPSPPAGTALVPIAGAQIYNAIDFTLNAANRGFLKINVDSTSGQTVTYSATDLASPAVLNGGQAAISWTGSTVASSLQVRQDNVTIGNVGALALNLNPLQVGGNVTNLNFRVIDSNGNVVTTATGTATVTVQVGSQFITLSSTSVPISGGQGTIQAQSTNSAGSATLRVTMTLPGMGTETVGNLNLTTSSTGGLASTLTVVGTASTLNATTNTSTITGTLRDSFGNVVSGVNITFTTTIGTLTGGLTTVTVATNASGEASTVLTAPAAATGSGTVTLTAAGSGVSTTFAFTYSTVIPADAWLLTAVPAAANTNAATVVVNVTTTADANGMTAVVRNTSNANAENTATISGGAAAVTVNLVAGVNTLQVFIQNAAGNRNPTPLVASVTRDSAALNITSTTPVNNATLDAGAAADATLTQAVTVVIDKNNAAGGEVRISVNGAAFSAWTPVDGVGSVSFAGQTLNVGTNTIAVEARDAAANTASTTVNVTVLPASPTVTGVATANDVGGTWYTQGSSVTITGAAATGAIVTATGPAGSGSATAAAGTYTLALPLNAGSNAVTINQTLNSQSAAAATAVTIVSDATAPVISAPNIGGGTVIATSSAGNPTTVVSNLQVTVNENTALAAPNPVEVSFDAGGTWTAMTDAGGGNWTADVTGLAEGARTYRVRATDAAGNVGTLPAPGSDTSFIVDNTAPVIGAAATSANASAVITIAITELNTPVLNGLEVDVLAAGLVTVIRNGNAVGVIGVAVVGGNLQITLASNNTTADALVVNVAAGVVRDAAGNRNGPATATGATP